MSANQNDGVDQSPMSPSNENIDKKNLDATSTNADEDMIFNKDVDIQYSSDEDIANDKKGKRSGSFSASSNLETSTSSGDSDSDSDSGSGSDSDSDSDSNSNSNSNSESGSSVSSSGSESDSETDSMQANIKDDIEEHETDDEGPIRSKNEKSVEVAPELPEDYTIPESTPIKYLGTVTSIVENSVLVQSAVSAEFQVLREGAVLCLENCSPLGILFEIFGRLQCPIFRVKFNNEAELKDRNIERGMKVYYVVPSAQFALTSQIRSIRGTDASNVNDEELPESEQDYSDDEEESRAKRERKRQRKSKAKDGQIQKRQQHGSGGRIPNYLKSRFTALPSSKPRGYQSHAKQSQSSNNTRHNSTDHANTSQAQLAALHKAQKQFMSIMNPQSSNLNSGSTYGQNMYGQPASSNSVSNSHANSYSSSSTTHTYGKPAGNAYNGDSLMEKMQFLIQKQAKAASGQVKEYAATSSFNQKGNSAKYSRDPPDYSDEKEDSNDSYDPANPGF